MQKNSFKTLLLGVCALALTACNLDFFPNDEVSLPQLSGTYEGLCKLTDGNYATLKTDMEYKGSSSTSYIFVRRAMEMLAFSGDELIISGRTSSTIWQAYTMEHTSDLRNVQYVWWNLYFCITGANTVIEAITDESDVRNAYLKGENYFLRAFSHLMLCNLYAWPYSHGRDNLGVPLRLTAGMPETITRATVGECYDQIEADLKEAIRLMSLGGQRRGNNGYASKEAAQGLLARIYLHEERNQECIDLINEMLGGADISSKLASTAEFPTYYRNTLTHPETLWAIGYTAQEGSRYGQSLYAGMLYMDPATGIGWGEAYPSDVLMDLYERYPEDLRYSSYIHPKVLNEEGYKARYTVKGDDYRDARANIYVTATKSGDEYSFTTPEGNTVTTYTEIENTYPVRYGDVNGEKMRIRICGTLEQRNSFPIFYVSKFCHQDGIAMLGSPSFVRWGELVLNRAEAYAKLGQDDKALADVNVIRRRAGIREEGMFTKANMASRGYATVLDVVLEERHLELAFEGFRTLDLIRNKRDIDRQFAGIHSWEVVKYNDPKILYPIPFDEVSVSGLQQNVGF